MAEPKWLDGYSGQTVDQLLALASEYRTDSLVLAFEQAIDQKAARDGEQALSDEECTVLAVEALEREVNNGGYSQFFLNSAEFAPSIIERLLHVGCPRTAKTAQAAVAALHVSEVTVEAIRTAAEEDNEERAIEIASCDERYYESGEPIADKLLDFIKANRIAVNF